MSSNHASNSGKTGENPWEISLDCDAEKLPQIHLPNLLAEENRHTGHTTCRGCFFVRSQKDPSSRKDDPVAPSKAIHVGKASCFCSRWWLHFVKMCCFRDLKIPSGNWDEYIGRMLPGQKTGLWIKHRTFEAVGKFSITVFFSKGGNEFKLKDTMRTWSPGQGKIFPSLAFLPFPAFSNFLEPLLALPGTVF